MHIRDEDLELYLMERLDEGRASTIESHLTDCVACETRLSSTTKTGAQLNEMSRKLAFREATEKRREPRLATDDPGFVQKIHPFSSDRTAVRVLDVSKRGMKLRTPSFLEPGTIVKVRLKSLVAFGDVRYCIVSGNEFHAGVQLHDVLQT